MGHCWSWNLSLLLLVVVVVDQKVIYAKEFCVSEIFYADCSKNEIISVNSAIYGRREYGRCLKKEGELDLDFLKKPGYINCSTDVRHIIEPQCAGLQRCDVTVARIEADSGCSKAFKDYLDIEYSCKKGDLVEF